jgi:hypothetical protein
LSLFPADFSDLYYQTSWWMLAMVAVVGAGVFLFGSRRLDKKAQRIGVVLIVLGIVLAIGRRVFPPAREVVERKSRELVSAVNKRDWNRLTSLLGDHATVGTVDHAYVSGRQRIVDLAKIRVDEVGLESVYTLGLESKRTETLITVSLEIVSTQAGSGDRPVTSSWQFDFDESGSDWTLDKITYLPSGENGEGNFSPFRQ